MQDGIPRDLKDIHEALKGNARLCDQHVVQQFAALLRAEVFQRDPHLLRMRQDIADDGLWLVAAQGMLSLLGQIIPLPFLVLDDGQAVPGQGLIDLLDQIKDAAS